MAKTIELDVWAPTIKDGVETGYVHYVEGRPLAEIYNELRAVLDEQDMIDEYFSVASDFKREAARWPNGWRWVACYAVTGGSEGHYVHVDVISDVEIGGKHVRTSQLIFLGKTFRGMDHAQKIAAACATALGA